LVDIAALPLVLMLLRAVAHQRQEALAYWSRKTDSPAHALRAATAAIAGLPLMISPTASNVHYPTDSSLLQMASVC
jgi:hypothetical protein